MADVDPNPWTPPEPRQEDSRHSKPRLRWLVGLGGLASFGAVSVALAWLVSPLVQAASACERDGPRVAAAMEMFARENAGQIVFGPAEHVICDSVPGVGVGLTARAPQTAAERLLESLEAGGCGPVTRSGVGYVARSCVLATGERITVEVITRGSLDVFVSHDF